MKNRRSYAVMVLSESYPTKPSKLMRLYLIKEQSNENNFAKSKGRGEFHRFSFIPHPLEDLSNVHATSQSI